MASRAFHALPGWREAIERLSPAVQKLLSDQGPLYLPNTTAQFEARIAEETARRARLIRKNKLELDQ